MEAHNLKSLAAQFGWSRQTLAKKVKAIPNINYAGAKGFTPKQLDMIYDELGHPPRKST